MKTAANHPSEPAIIVFDGVCHLCNATVRFVVHRDPAAHFQFLPIQSPRGRQICAEAGQDPDAPGSLLVLTQGRVLIQSDAILEITAHLTWPWSMLRFGRLLPRPVRDWGYRCIARNRYRLFGRSDTCMIPTAELRSRFLD